LLTDLPHEAYFNIEELPFHTGSTGKEFNILIYILDFYVVSAYTTPIFVKLRPQLSERVSF
jgi:hypothetical protein